MSENILQADQVAGAPHPRETSLLLGQQHAEQNFLDAFNTGRLHHAWLISGPEGVGKATLAWKIARFLLATPIDDGGLFGAPEPPNHLDIPPDHPVQPRVAALSEPRLFLLRRQWDTDKDRLQAQITVDAVRKLKGFFSLSAADGGRRVVIIDAADELNVNAANAVLKLLEEPPDDTVILLVSHQPARLLPTIRSRCRTLRCQSLTSDTIAQVLHQSAIDFDGNASALTALSGGSAGVAIRLITLNGLALYQQIVDLFTNGLDRPAALKLAESLTGRQKAEELDLTLDLIDLFLSRLARSNLREPGSEAAQGEAQLFATLNPSPHHSRHWAVLAQEISARARHAQSVNLDPPALILDITLKIHQRAADLVA